MNRGIIALLILGAVLFIGLVHGPSEEMQKKYPRDGLTDAQAVAIVDDCIQHPDALRCR